MVQRWLYSTNAKDIAVLYFIFALFSGMAGTAMSVIVRMELSAPGVQYLGGNNQLFNVLATGHAILMIFFLVMPALIGGFGKITAHPSFGGGGNKKWYINNFEGPNKKTLGTIEGVSREKWGPYLAGLIEGDGTFYVPLNLKRPTISIVFHKDDKPLAIYLKNLLNMGNLYEKKGNFLIWQIQKMEDVYKIVNLTNGFYRTPKYYEFMRLIDWFNRYIDKNINNTTFASIHWKMGGEPMNKIKYLELDKSDLNTNSWLAGFTDADGNFNIQLLNNRIKLQFRLEIRKVFHKDMNYYKDLNNNYINLNLNYYEIMMNISKLFNTSLYSRNRELNFNGNPTKIYSSYIMAVYNMNNLKLVKEYFNKYPLLSSKYLNYKDWEKLLDLVLKYNKFSHPNIFKLAKVIKTNYNKNRTSFSWKHLNNNYFYK
ncbi:AI1 (mitochondrion) [Zygosaccharomyces parabailii]|nr:AI1 [Zygosaccharomyces parabailii]